MENNELITVTSDSQTVSTRFRRNFDFLGWILFFGLILLLAGTVVDSLDWNRRSINKILYSILCLVDPRYWSISLIPILWGAVCWIVTDFLCYFDFIRKYRFRIRLIIVAGVLCAIDVLGGKRWRLIRMYIYYNLYQSYIVGPMVHYMVTGVLSWKMLIAPASIGIIIVFLLRIIIKHRRKNS
ncbi:MAG: hypothetical protein LBF88_14250 [Planctomycetaceae bacterium]|jgi:hypothetical protein|nr:hypothetical protein [Planctomycetaceae bacterium]